MLQELHINAYGHQNTWLYIQTRNKRNTIIIFPTTQIVTPLPSPLLENMNECSIPSAAIAFICHVGARKFARFPFLFSRQLLTNKKFSTFFKKSVQRYVSSIMGQNEKLNSVYDNDVIDGTKNKIHKMKVSTLTPIDQDQIDILLSSLDYQSIKLLFFSLV